MLKRAFQSQYLPKSICILMLGWFFNVLDKYKISITDLEYIKKYFTAG